MSLTLKRNTDLGGYCLHSFWGYAYCPYNPGKPCGTWCALFGWNEERKCIVQRCGNDATIYVAVEED